MSRPVSPIWNFFRAPAISFPRGWVGVVLVMGLFMAASGCTWEATNRPKVSERYRSGPPALVEGDTARTAPDFSLQTLADTAFRLSAHRGEVVVVNFWATWCAPCRKEIPDFVQLQDRFGDEGLRFVGITTESGKTEDIRAFTDSFDVNYPIVRGGTQVTQKYGGVSMLPTTYVVDRKGRVRYGRIGRVPPDTLTKVFRDLL